jgi:hypothetical protein
MLMGAAVLVLVAIGTFVLPAGHAGAQTDENGVLFVGSYYDEDGVLYELYVYDGQTYEWILYPDGTAILVEWGNPNPDDPSGSDPGMGMDAMLALLKQHGGPAIPTVDFLGTPLGVALVEGGKTIVPIHNPADLANIFEDAGGMGGGAGGFDPMGGSIQEQLKQGARNGEDDDANGDGSDPLNGEGFWNGLPGPPEVVNPPPAARN